MSLLTRPHCAILGALLMLFGLVGNMDYADQLRIEESRIGAQKEIAAMQVGASAAAAKDKLQKHQLLEGTRIGVDIAKNKAQMAVQMAQRASQKPKKE